MPPLFLRLARRFIPPPHVTWDVCCHLRTDQPQRSLSAVSAIEVRQCADSGYVTLRVILAALLFVIAMSLVAVILPPMPAPAAYRLLLAIDYLRPAFPGMLVPVAALTAAGIAGVVALAGVNRSAETSRWVAASGNSTSLSIMTATLAQKNSSDEAVLQLQRDRDRRDQSWRRVQWAVDMTATDADPDRRGLGLLLLGELAQRKELPPEDLLLVNLVLDRVLGRDPAYLSADEPDRAGLSDGVILLSEPEAPRDPEDDQELQDDR